MPSFTKGGGVTTPFGKREYLRSTRGNKYESYTLAGATVPSRSIDGNPGQKVLQPGTAMAKITSGPDAGKVGPFQAGVTDGRQTAANIVGLNDTFLPWQTIERDVEIGVAYTAIAVQGWCVELDAGGAEIPLTNGTADAMRGTKGLDILFK
jgi:hypothetical protein